MTRRRLGPAFAGALILLAACGSESAPEARRSDSPSVATTLSPEAGLAAAQAGAAAEIERLSWPKAYRPTVEGLTSKMGDPEEFVLNREEGVQLADIWNLCAWIREGIDRIEAGASPTQLGDVADQIREWAADESDAAYYGDFVDGIRTGDPTAANEYIAASDCANFPS